MESRMQREETGGMRESKPREGELARTIESQTAKLPSDVWLWASIGSMVVSLGLQLSDNKKNKAASNFIGQWAPTLLILGLYNKLVKVGGHDKASA
jgi:hypothetical protein